MLAPRAPKHAQHVLRGRVSTRLGQGADRPTHGLVGDLDEPGEWECLQCMGGEEGGRPNGPPGNLVDAEVLLQIVVDRRPELLEEGPGGLDVQFLVLVGPEDLRELARD
ncbi:hypothetical protein PTTG_11550, partial [Puccinia triticina 1-1 BBBD Race 1]